MEFALVLPPVSPSDIVQNVYPLQLLLAVFKTHLSLVQDVAEFNEV